MTLGKLVDKAIPNAKFWTEIWKASESLVKTLSDDC